MLPLMRCLPGIWLLLAFTAASGQSFYVVYVSLGAYAYGQSAHMHIMRLKRLIRAFRLML